jgi:hypothetical protein
MQRRFIFLALIAAAYGCPGVELGSAPTPSASSSASSGSGGGATNATSSASSSGTGGTSASSSSAGPGGSGGMKGVNGSVCSIGDQCTSGNCRDGFCCDKPCMGQCEACNGTIKGTCAPLVAAERADKPCPADQLCEAGACTYAAAKWARGIGSSEGDALSAIAVDGTGIYIGGVMNGAIDFGGGPLPLGGNGNQDAFVAKRSVDSAHLWATSLFGPEDKWVSGVAVTTKGTVVAGGTFSDKMFLGVLDAGHQLINQADSNDRGFVATFNTANGQMIDKMQVVVAGSSATSTVTAVAASPAGVLVTGTFFGTLTYNVTTTVKALDGAGYVALLDEQNINKVLWFVKLGDSINVEPRSLAMRAGEVVVSGDFYETTIATTVGNFTAKGYDGFALTLNAADGVAKSFKQFKSADNSSEYQFVSAVAYPGPMGLLVAGQSHDAIELGDNMPPPQKPNVFLAAYDDKPALQWKRAFTNYYTAYYTDQSIITGLAVDNANRVVIGGTFDGKIEIDPVNHPEYNFAYDPNAYFYCPFMAGFGPNDNVAWARAILPTKGEGHLGAMALLSGGKEAVIGGWFDDTMPLADGSLTSKGGYDLWLARVRLVK